jgi:hypothetical protein
MKEKGSMLNLLIERCFKLGQDTPNLSEDEISKRLATIIVSEKILDDDAFEIARTAYEKGIPV